MGGERLLLASDGMNISIANILQLGLESRNSCTCFEKEENRLGDLEGKKTEIAHFDGNKWEFCNLELPDSVLARIKAMDCILKVYSLVFSSDSNCSLLEMKLVSVFQFCNATARNQE